MANEIEVEIDDSEEQSIPQIVLPQGPSPVERTMGALATGTDFESRTMYLVGEVEDTTAFKFMVGFRILDEEEGPIKIVLNSMGGSEPDGYAIYDIIRLSQNHVTIEAYGACQSIAAAVMQAGDTRLMGPEASFMVHNGSLAINGGIEQDRIIRIANHITEETARYYRILQAGSGLPMSKVKQMCEAETFMDAKVAKRYNLIDGVLKRTRKKKR